jgi:hypothetical protein
MACNPTVREETNPQTIDALDRWDDEGGAIVTPVSKAVLAHVGALTATECQVLQCLGAAVVMRWNDLPADVQRSLFRAASEKGAVDPARELPVRIARFLHNNKSKESTW